MTLSINLASCLSKRYIEKHRDVCVCVYTRVCVIINYKEHEDTMIRRRNKETIS